MLYDMLIALPRSRTKTSILFGPIHDAWKKDATVMKFERTGLILCTERYDECVKFYSEILGLPVLEALDDQHSKLTTFGFGKDTYLMVETGGVASPTGKTPDKNPIWLRFNVRSVEDAARELVNKGIDVTIRIEAWGTVGDFVDPDGNFCSFREEPAGWPAY